MGKQIHPSCASEAAYELGMVEPRALVWGDWTAWESSPGVGMVSEASCEIDGYDAVVRVALDPDGPSLAPVISQVTAGVERVDEGNIPSDILEEISRYGIERLDGAHGELPHGGSRWSE